MKWKLRQSQEKCRAMRQNVLTSVAEVFTLANELLGSTRAHTSMAKRAPRVNRGEVLEVEPKNVADGQEGSCKALVDAHIKETRDVHVCELDAVRDFLRRAKASCCKSAKSGLRSKSS